MASSARIDELRKKFDENPRRYFAPLANEYRKSGDLQQAIFICQEYLPQQPGHMSGHIVYGQALFESSRFDEAQAVFETALSLDPENLIALKHLGDIAREAGDLKAARIWYQRVLEADPRNEEIAQLMISLLAVPEPAPTPATPVVQAPPVGREPLSREPLRPTPPASVDESELVVEKSENEPAPQATRTPTPVFSETVAPPPLPPLADSTKALDGQDFLSLEDFNLGGASIAAGPSDTQRARSLDESDFARADAASKSAQPSDLPSDVPIEPSQPDVARDSGFDLGTEEGPFEADPFAIASAPVSERRDVEQSPEIELAADLRLGLPDDESSEPMDEHRTAESLAGLETFEPGVIDTLSTPSEPLNLEESFGEVSAAATSEPDVAHDSMGEPEPEPEPEAEAQPEPESAAPAQTFVTETMAELYLRQGHVESALDIYRQLAEQRPGDGLLLDRLREVEARVRDEAIAAEAAAASAVSAPARSATPAYGGPTIREFLSGLASRRTPIFATAIDTATPDQDPEPSSAGPTPSGSVSGSVSGSIDALFGGAQTSPSDAAAASTLQEAFATDGPETAPLRGVPAHTAASELSLDHVFKGNAPPPPDNDGFSFDQFFADEMTDAAPNGAGEGSAPSQPVDDIAQFNAWLNGLKKT